LNYNLLADALLRARRSGVPARDLPVPGSLDEAYAVQDHMAAQLGPIGGWKIGAGSPSDEPLFAPMPRAWMTETPLNNRLRGIEVEIAFRLGRDLPRRGERYGRSEVIDAMAAAHPALEIIESGLPDPDAVPRLLKIADMQVHGGFLAGPAIPNWQNVDWTRETATLRVNAELSVQRTGSNTAGDLIRLLVYLANEGGERTKGLYAGQWITTGSWTGITFCGPKDQAEGQFTHSSPVRLTFA
jgi:2-keto-4-pentenoate hydratase